MATQTKTRVKRHLAIKKAAWESSEPLVCVGPNYNLDLTKALTFYGIEVDKKIKRDWAIDFWKSQKKNTQGLTSIEDGWFSQAGALARIVSRGGTIEQKHMEFLEEKYSQFFDMVTSTKIDNTEVAHNETRPNIQERMDEIAANHIGEFEGALDEFCLSGETALDPKQYIKVHDIKAPVAKRIGEHFKKHLGEYKEVANKSDEQLSEAYKYLGQVRTKKIISFIETIIKDCSMMAIIAKTTRAPRKKKAKPASVQVNKMKYLRMCNDLNLKSVHAEKIIDSDTVYLYDVVKRKMFKYVALDGAVLAVRGTTILNFDPEKSCSKAIRKPEITMKDIGNLSKRPLNNLFNDLKSKPIQVNGRTNDNCLIINTFN